MGVSLFKHLEISSLLESKQLFSHISCSDGKKYTAGKKVKGEI